MKGRQFDEPKPFEKAFGKYDCEELIFDALDGLTGYQDKFSYSTLKPFIDRPKQMRRNGIYLLFKCSKCKQGSLGQKKKFTSTLGTVSIEFQLQQQGRWSRQLTRWSKYPYRLVFQLHIYRMKCRECGVYGEPEVYENQMNFKIVRAFCKIIRNILDEIPPKHIENQRLIQPDLTNHQHERCEACQNGICHPPFPCYGRLRVRDYTYIVSDSESDPDPDWLRE